MSVSMKERPHAMFLQPDDKQLLDSTAKMLENYISGYFWQGRN